MIIKKGDTVVVITGKDKGKTGKVLEVYPKENRVLVDGVNVVSRHSKPRSAQDKGGIVKKSAPIHASNVMIYEDGQATRVAYKFIDGKKVRVSKKTGNSLDKEFVKAVKKQAKDEVKAAKPAKKETVKKETAKTAEPKAVKPKKVATEKTTVKKTVAKSGK